MPTQPIFYRDFSGGLNEGNEPERISRNQLATSLDVDLTLGKIDRRLGWKPLHDTLDPFFPSTLHAEITLSPTLGDTITDNEWTLQFLCKIREKKNDGSTYTLIGKGRSDGGGGIIDALHLYWVDSADTGVGGFFLGYSSPSHASPGPEFGYSQLIDPTEVPDAGDEFVVLIRKVAAGGGTFDLELHVLTDTTDDTGSLSSVGSDSFQDTFSELASPFSLGFYQPTETGLVSDDTAPITVGEFQVWSGSRSIAHAQKFAFFELPPGERTDGSASLVSHIPMSSPTPIRYRAEFGEWDAFHGAGPPGFTSTGDTTGPPAGLSYHNFGATSQIIADPDWADSLTAASPIDFFFSFSGIASGILPLISIPVSDAAGVAFSISLFESDDSDLKVRVEWINGGSLVEQLSTLTIQPGEAFTASVHYLHDPTNPELTIVVTQGTSTSSETFTVSVDPDTSGSDEGSYFVMGSRLQVQSSANNRLEVFQSGLGVISRVLIRLGDAVSDFDHEAFDQAILRPSDPVWERLELIFQPPAKNAIESVAPVEVTVEKGRHPDTESGRQFVVIQNTFELTKASVNPAPWRVHTDTMSLTPFDPVRILWAGQFRLRSQAKRSELSLVLIAGGFYAIENDGSVTAVGFDLPLDDTVLPEVFTAQGFVFVQPRRAGQTFMFDGAQVLPAVGSAPLTVDVTTPTGASTFTGDLRYKFSFFNARTGTESNVRKTIDVSPSSQDVQIDWDSDEADDGVSTFRIYRTALDDEEGNLFLIAEVPVEDETYTDTQAQILISNDLLEFDTASSGGTSAAFLLGRFWFSDNFTPEVISYSPVGRPDRIEGFILAPSPVKRFFTSQNVLVGLSDAHVLILTGTAPVNFSITAIADFSIPSSDFASSVIRETSFGGLVYYTTRGLVLDNLQQRDIVSNRIETTLSGFDFTKPELLSIGSDPKFSRTYITGITQGSSRPDRMIVWSRSRTQGSDFFTIYRLPVDFICEATKDDQSVTAFGISGFMCELDNPRDGVETALDFTITGASTADKLVASGASTGDLNGRSLYRVADDTSYLVAYNIGDEIYLNESLPGTPAGGETFNAGRILGEFSLKEEAVMQGPRYHFVSRVMIRGSGGDVSLSTRVDTKTQTATLDMDDDSEPAMFVGESGRKFQISGTLEEVSEIDEIEAWVRPLAHHGVA